MRIKIVFVAVALLLVSRCSHTCEDSISESFHGKVIRKSHTPKNHDYRHVQLQLEDEKLEWMYIPPIDMKLWDMLLVGDSIYKRQNTREIFIKRGNRVYPYELQCQSRFR